MSDFADRKGEGGKTIPLVFSFEQQHFSELKKAAKPLGKQAKCMKYLGWKYLCLFLSCNAHSLLLCDSILLHVCWGDGFAILCSQTPCSLCLWGRTNDSDHLCLLHPSPMTIPNTAPPSCWLFLCLWTLWLVLLKGSVSPEKICSSDTSAEPCPPPALPQVAVMWLPLCSLCCQTHSCPEMPEEPYGGHKRRWPWEKRAEG